ncbi:MAG: hypothetical protein NC930_01300, partial [Candidatus Omnitrophica bacterium]|nr:hypothetical protein [Candidatus Omnitrophota bacterium]
MTTSVGSTLNPEPTVQILDADGNVVLGDSSTVVTIAIGTNPSNGTLEGTKTETAASGEANFTGNGLYITKVGSGYTLTATASGITSATSEAFDII